MAAQVTYTVQNWNRGNTKVIKVDTETNRVVGTERSFFKVYKSGEMGSITTWHGCKARHTVYLIK